MPATEALSRVDVSRPPFYTNRQLSTARAASLYDGDTVYVSSTIPPSPFLSWARGVLKRCCFRDLQVCVSVIDPRGRCHCANVAYATDHPDPDKYQPMSTGALSLDDRCWGGPELHYRFSNFASCGGSHPPLPCKRSVTG